MAKPAPIVASTSQTVASIVKMLLGGAFLLFAAMVVIGLMLPPWGVALIIVGGVMGVAALVAFIVVWRHYSDTSPVLFVDERGIFDRRYLSQTIPWTAIKKLQHIQPGNRIFMGVDVDGEPTRFFKPQNSGMNNMTKGWNASQGFPVINIPLNTFEQPKEELAAGMNAWFAHMKA